MEHPTSGVSFFVPEELHTASKYDPRGYSKGEEVTQATEGDQGTDRPDHNPGLVAEESQNVIEAGSEPKDPVSRANEGKGPSSRALGPRGYLLGRKDLLEAVVNPRSPWKGRQNTMMRQSSTKEIFSSALNKAIWREDMDTAVLGIKRNVIRNQLLHFAQLTEKEERKYVIRCENYEDAKQLKHRGCLLYLGPGPEARAASSTTPAGGLPGPPPAQLSVLNIEGARFGSKLAVHNLDVLLGEENVTYLRHRAGIFRDGSLFLLGRQATVKLQMNLWKLQGYLSRDSR